MKQAVAAALVLCAMPATVFSQQVDCRDCNHVAPWFRGEGGFIGTVAGEAEAVTFVASCGNVSITGKVEAEGGTVAQLFNHRNGLACDRDGGSLEIAGLEDGGWYWITDASNSAVGNLVSRDILNNKAVELTRAGPGVTMSTGRGAVFVKETSTGRVGILPNILPEPPAAAAVICGPRQSSSWPYAYDWQMTSSCMLGDGGTGIRLTGPGAYGTTATITNGMVYRPQAGTITVTADLWLNESGSYSTDTSGTDSAPTVASIQQGWAGKTASALGGGSGTNWLDATFSASVNATVGAPVAIAADGSTTVAGVTQTNTGSTAVGTNPVGQAVFTIGPDSSYCSSSANHTAVVNIAATPAATNTVHPAIATGNAAGLGRSAAVAAFSAITQLSVVCAPASSANQGQELVPDNPFPPAVD